MTRLQSGRKKKSPSACCCSEHLAKKHANNKVCPAARKAGAHLSRATSRERFHHASYLFPEMLQLVCLSVLPEQNQPCLISAAGAGVVLKTHHFASKSWSRNRPGFAARLHLCKSSPMSAGVQGLTVECSGLGKWGRLHRSAAVSSSVSVQLVHSSCALREILGSPFVAGDDAESRKRY